MFSNDEWRHVLKRPDMPEEELEEFLRSLRAFLGQILDEYFREEFHDE